MEEEHLSTQLLREKEKEDESEGSLPKRVWIESKKMWVVAGPATFTRFSTFGIAIIAQAFIGHIGSTELAAFALVTTVLLRFATGILLGMSSALETLCGQAYGANEYHMLGVYLQRSWIILVLCTLFLLPVFIFTSPILVFLGQEKHIADCAGILSLWLIPILFTYVISYSTQAYLQAQSRNMVVVYLASLSLVLHVGLCWFGTSKYHWGIPGVMGSYIFSMWIPNLGQLFFIFFGGCPLTWNGFSMLAFKDLWSVLKLSLSSGVMICLELWYNSLLVLLTGNLKDAELQIDALSICLNINGWEMMISMGFLAAAGVRVANELGRGSSKAAKFSIAVTTLTSLFIGIVLFVFFILFRGRLAYVFTNSEAVAKAVGQLSPLLATSILLNSVQPVLSGVAVGAGWQSIVAYVNIACYYLIGIPLGAVLGYVVNYKVVGVWIGMLLGTLVQTIVLLIITWRTNWDKQVSLARERVNKWSVPKHQEESNNGRQQA